MLEGDDREASNGLTEKVTFKSRLEAVRKTALWGSGGKSFTGRGKACAKALRRSSPWRAGKRTKTSVLEGREPGEGIRRWA